MGFFLGIRSYNHVYERVMLYGPRPVNSGAARGVSKKNKKKAACNSVTRKKSSSERVGAVTSGPFNERTEVSMPQRMIVNGKRVFLLPR